MKYIFIGLLSALMFGISTPVNKYMLQSADPLALVSLYYLSSALILIPFVFKNFKKELSFISQNDLWKLLGTCIFGGVLAPGFLLYGIRLTSAASASLLMNLETAATATLAHFIFRKERLQKKDWIGALGIVTAGGILVFEKGWIPNLGGVFIALSCLCWGFDNNFTANIRTISPITNAFFKGLFAGLTNAFLSLAIQAKWPSENNLLIVLLLGMFCFGISIVLYIICARKIGAFRSQVLFATSPFWGVGVSLIFLKEPFIFHQAIAAMVLIVSLTCIFYQPTFEKIPKSL